MRAITQEATSAFFYGASFNKSNTQVKATANGAEMYLHGNLIAVRKGQLVKITDAGWQTSTTKERLNGIYSTIHGNNGVVQRRGVWLVSGKPMAEQEDAKGFVTIAGGGSGE